MRERERGEREIERDSEPESKTLRKEVIEGKRGPEKERGKIKDKKERKRGKSRKILIPVRNV